MVAPGTRLGSYDVLALLGRGGMGEVYRAHDSRLNRDVAIKVLPPALTRDADRLVRFSREAQLLASLNHPNIATVHGLEDSDGVSAIVMEFVEGDTLAERIAGSPIPIDDALRLIGQIADALEAAHDRGIIHRDLKPANIKIRPDGTVKVLDFGLAKALEPASALSVQGSGAPTATSPAMTGPGVLLGTAAYMSPEQAKGRPADKRSDIWGFGCVLYEMLTGRRAFEGEDVSDSLAFILTKEPNWAALPSTTPPSIRRLLRRSLEKNRKRRLADIADARIEIDEASERPEADSSDRSTSSGARSSQRGVLWALSCALALTIVALLLTWRAKTTPGPPTVVRTAIVLPEGSEIDLGFRAYPLALSPDGLHLVYVAESGGRKQLYRRELADLEATPLAGTFGATHPFFSPDGEWVGYFARELLQKVSIHGGAPLPICPVSGISMGGAWGPDGTIVFAALDAGLFTIASTGGTPVRVPGSEEVRWPEILPDGKTILATTESQIISMSFDGRNKRVLGRTDDDAGHEGAALGPGALSPVRYLPTGHLVFGHGNFRMRVVAFDLATQSLRGSPVSIVDSVYRSADGGPLYFAVSKTGVLVYAPEDSRRRLVWVERDGRVIPIGSDREAFRYPAVSPDGRRIAVDINTEERRSDIWIYDAARGTRTRLTSEHASILPLWSRDGQITFSSGSIHRQAPGGDVVTILKQTAPNIYPTSWSPDERTLLFTEDHPTTGMDLWALLVGGGPPRKLLVSRFNEEWAHFSKDGRWITYASDESGNEEVYVADFRDMANRFAVSTRGGAWPVWSPDSHEVFYRQGNAMMATPIETAPALRAGVPRQLFSGPYAGVDGDRKFDVAPDGRFLMIARVDPAISRQLVVVQNWFAELRERVPSK